MTAYDVRISDWSSYVFSSDLLEQGDCPLAAMGTDADDGAGSDGPRPELLHRLAQVPRARCAKGVANRDRPTVGVDPIPRDGTEIHDDARLRPDPPAVLDGSDVRQYLGGEGFVDLSVIYVDRQSTRLKSRHYCAYRMPSFA